MKFIFFLFDFDENNVIDLNEFVCSCKSILTGICKLSKMESPPISDIETYA